MVADVCVLDLVRSGSRHAAADYSPLDGMLAAVLAALADHVQKDQPDGVPPLELTGERTLPDVPAENYWFRRHLAVYEWVARSAAAGWTWWTWPAARAMARDVLARRAAQVTGVDANPEAHEHARLKYTRPGVRFVRDLVETSQSPATPSSSADDRARARPEGGARPLPARSLRPRGTAYVSTPNVLTLAPRAPSARATPGT